MTVDGQATPAPDAGPFSWRRWLPRAVFESALIVFSVFLGLALSQQAEDRRTVRRVEEARGFFAEEIALNCQRLASPTSLPYHRQLLTQVQAALEGGQPAQAEEAAFRRGVQPMLFRDAVWRSLSAGELLESMEPREIFALASLYKLQDKLSEINAGMQVTVMQAMAQAETSGGLAKSLRLYFGDVIAVEGELMQLYPEVLRLLDAEAAAEACARDASRATAPAPAAR